MKILLLLLAFASAIQLTSCQTDADIRPSNYDALALATGHWEWESSSYQSGLKTPATVGFTRQVIFGREGNLVVYRSGQAAYRTTYQLSMGIPKPCGSSQPVPLVNYTSEQDLGNTDTKTYSISQHNGQQLLSIAGEALCVDGGAFETYHWVAE